MTATLNGINQFSILVGSKLPTKDKQQFLDFDGNFNIALIEDQIETQSALIQERFDLIVLEGMMVNPLVLKTIRHGQSLNLQTPVIALTEPTVSLDERKSLISLGYDDFLDKPLTIENLTKLIHVWLGSNEFEAILTSIQNLLTKVKENRQLALNLWLQLFDELPFQINEIKKSLKNNAFQNAYDVVHNLNGSAKVCCLSEIEFLATNMEKNLLANRYENIDFYHLTLEKKINSILNRRYEIINYLKTQ